MASEGSAKRSRAMSGMPVILDAFRHPIRARILARLAEGPSSPTEMARDFGVAIGVIDYHARRLAELGAASVVETRRVGNRRGPPRHYYEAEPVVVSDEDWARVPIGIRRALIDAALREVIGILRGPGARA
jgi:DNA-binding transcriptional ArsR family regulator